MKEIIRGMNFEFLIPNLTHEFIKDVAEGKCKPSDVFKISERADEMLISLLKDKHKRLTDET